MPQRSEAQYMNNPVVNTATPGSVATVTHSRAWQAVIGVFMQMVVAIVYSWSVFRGPLAQLYGWSKTQTIMPYRYSLLMVSVGMVIAGLWQDRKGPKIVAATGGMLMALGCLISALLSNSVIGLVIGYGVIA